MFGPVLVPLDGSKESETILGCVRELHAANGCEVVLLHVHREQDAMHAAYIEDVKKRLEADGVPSVRIADIPGQVEQGLLDVAKAQKARLIALSPHHRPGLVGTLLGTMIEHIVHNTSIPVLSARAGGSRDVEGTPLLERIVVAVDGSELSLKTLPVVQSLVGEGSAEIVLLHVSHPGEGDLETTPEDYEAILDARRVAEASGMKVTCEVVPGRVVAQTLIDRAARSQAGLIAIATHGRTGLARLALGSVADALLRQSPIPVLAVH